jgi:hypothetical protein
MYERDGKEEGEEGGGKTEFRWSDSCSRGGAQSLKSAALRVFVLAVGAAAAVTWRKAVRIE